MTIPKSSVFYMFKYSLCVEAQPTCQRCQKLNIACHYSGLQLTWQNDSEARGVSHGRKGIWRKYGEEPHEPAEEFCVPTSEESRFPPLESLHFLNTTFQDMALYYGADSDVQADDVDGADASVLADEFDTRRVIERTRSAVVSRVHTSMNMLRYGLSTFPVQSRPDDSVLLSYYDMVICASRTLLDDEQHNPYRHVLLPMAFTSPGLFHATLAISAYTLHLREPKFAVVALEHRQRALQALIQLINQEESDARTMDEILGLILMLCWYDISDRCRSSWVKHLVGFHGLLLRRRAKANLPTSLLSQRLQKFAHQYFIFHLVLAKATFHDQNTNFGNTPISDFLFSTAKVDFASNNLFTTPLESTLASPIPELPVTFPQTRMDDIDLYMGFSNSLLLLIDETTNLTMAVSGSNPTQHNLALLTRAHSIKTSIEKLKARDSEIGPSRGMVEEGYIVAAIAEVYRLGAFLFLHEVLANPDLAFPYHRRVFAAEDRDIYMSGILDIVSSNVSTICAVATMPLWPLFLAGCCARKESDRVRVLQIFEHTEMQCRFGNVIPARMTLKALWRQQDLRSDEPPQPRRASTAKPRHGCSHISYEWERVLDQLGGWKISLT